MSHAKQTSKRKRLNKAVPMAGIAGVSFALAGGASANAPTANLPSQAAPPPHEITLSEEEISDVSLATFYVFDKDNEPQLGQRLRFAAGCKGGGGGGGCGGPRLRGRWWRLRRAAAAGVVAAAARLMVPAAAGVVAAAVRLMVPAAAGVVAAAARLLAAAAGVVAAAAPWVVAAHAVALVTVVAVEAA